LAEHVAWWESHEWQVWHGQTALAGLKGKVEDLISERREQRKVELKAERSLKD
jgi:hypothetical protein